MSYNRYGAKRSFRPRRTFGRKSYKRGYHPHSVKTRFKRHGGMPSYHAGHHNRKFSKPQFVRVSRGGIRL